MNEKEIFSRICQGDESALEEIYKKYYRMMTKLVISNSGTEDEAKDIYQEALIVKKKILKNTRIRIGMKESRLLICASINWMKPARRF